MANLPANDQEWQEEVYQIEKSDPVLGGPDGITNLPLKQLASRTAYLKRILAEIEQQIADLNYSDVNAAPKKHTHTTSEVTGLETALSGKVPTTRKVNGKSLSADVSLTATDVGAAPTSHTHTIAQVANLQTTLDGKASTSHGHADLVPTTRKVNSKALSADITLTATDVAAFAERALLTATVNLNSLCNYSDSGVYYNNADVNATTANNYPITEAGTLFVTKSAYGCQQMYTSYSSGRTFVRGLYGISNGSGPWSEWKEFSLSTHEHSDLVPTTRKVNSKALSADITLTATDVGAAPTSHTHTIAQVANLQTTLDGKASTSHGHSNLANANASNIDVPSFLNKLGLKEVSLSENGWVKLPCGLIFQWGRVPAQTNVIFTIAFPNKTLQVINQIEYRADAIFGGWDVYPENITKTGFNRPDQAAGCRWFAIGY